MPILHRIVSLVQLQSMELATLSKTSVSLGCVGFFSLDHARL